MSYAIITGISKMNELQIIKVLAVRASEENTSKLLSQIAVSKANISAISAKSDEDFIAKRANFLFNLLPASIKLVENINSFPGNWVKLTLLISFIIGLLSNYLGPSKLIHVVYNPLTILLVWNICIYLIIILKSFWKIRLPEKLPKAKQFLSDKEQEDKANKKRSSNFLLDWVIGNIYKGIIKLKSRFIDDRNSVVILKKILPSYWISYKDVAGKTLILRFKSLANVSAVGLLTGALAGVYFRGLFFNYNIIWQSTFVFEPDTIRTILNSLFGLASLIIEGSFISKQTILPLLEPEGTMAAPWIHIMTLTTLLFIFIPRTILAYYYGRKSKRSIYNIDINEEYYQEFILKNRSSLVEIIRVGISKIILKKIKLTGQTISEFIINDYYNKIIAPILISFRENGGKIKTMENKLFESQEKFEPMLLDYLHEVQEDFNDSVLTEINHFLNRKLLLDINTVSTYQPQSDEIDLRLSGKIATDIGDTIGGTIVTSIALAVGSISGGIGKSLGIAIISGLLGVSGPIGLLIGGVITAITLGGFYKLKREQISGMIKDISLPSFVTSVALHDSKIEKARIETFTHTENEINKMLEPKIKELSDRILKDITY